MAYLGGRVAFWYWQRQAEQYSLPSGTPVYTTDPALATRLISSGRGYDSTGVAAVLHPAVWIRLGHYAGLRPDSDGPLFLHVRRRPDGIERISAVRVGARAYVFGTVYLDIEPQTYWVARSGTGNPMSAVASGAVRLIQRQDDRVTIYAGQIDPTDASHFTIAYSINGLSGTLDGWLQNDDTVRFVARDGPLKN